MNINHHFFIFIAVFGLNACSNPSITDENNNRNKTSSGVSSGSPANCTVSYQSFDKENDVIPSKGDLVYDEKGRLTLKTEYLLGIPPAMNPSMDDARIKTVTTYAYRDASTLYLQ